MPWDEKEIGFDFNTVIPAPVVLNPVIDAAGENGNLWKSFNWGTKWNSRVFQGVFADGNYEMRFDTAWSAPVPVIDKLAEMYPTLAFTFRYEESMMNFAGTIVYQNGKKISDEEYEPKQEDSEDSEDNED